eukprot:gene3987-7243_t
MTFDKTKIIIHFTAVFTNKKVGEAFQKFLETEQNTDPLNFLFALQKLKEVEKDSEKIKKVKEIIDNYVVHNSPKEVNVSDTTKSYVLENFKQQEKETEKWVLETSPEELFSEIFYSVYEELRQDSFHRFVRTKLCDTAIKNYRNDSTVVSPYVTKKFDYKDSSFTTGVVTDNDIEFAKLLCDDSFTWDLLSSNKNQWVNAYFSSANYLPDINYTTNSSKYESTLPVPFHKAILAFMCDESIMSDPNAAGMKCLGHMTTEQLEDYFKKKGMDNQMEKCKRTNMISCLEAIFGFPFNMRVLPQAFAAHYEPETKTLYCIFKPYIDDFSKFGTFEEMELSQKGTNKKKMVKAMHMFDFTLRKFQKLDENKTLYQEVTLGNVGGWGKGEGFGKMIVKSRAAGLRKSVLETCSRFSDDVKISDFKEKFSKMNDNGTPMDMYGKVLIDLDIEKMDKEYEETLKKESNRKSASISIL